MAKQIANVEILTDTFNTWLLRTNDIIDVIGKEVLTANSTLGVTGSPASPRNARLFGSFTANTFAGNSINLGVFSANAQSIVLGPGIKLVANNSAGVGGQILTTDGTSVYWSTASGTGTVTYLANGAGIVGGLVTATGTWSVKAGDGIVVDTRGVSVNSQFIQTFSTAAQTLQGRTWEIPGAIGATTANSGNFTTVTANPTQGYRIAGDTVFLISNSMFRTQGWVDATTPNIGSTGGVRVRGNAATNIAYLQITDSVGSTEWGNFKFHSNGYCSWSGSMVAASFPTLIPSGTVMLFAQTSAPTGWTKITTHDNKALRVVSGTASSGGTTGFTSAFNTQFSSDGHTLDITEIPTHNHSGTLGISYGGSWQGVYGFEEGRGNPDWQAGSIGATGGGQAHSHTMNFNLAYVDVILASKN